MRGERSECPIGRVEKLGILQKAQARWHACAKSENNNACVVAWKNPAFRAGSPFRHN